MSCKKAAISLGANVSCLTDSFDFYELATIPGFEETVSRIWQGFLNYKSFEKASYQKATTKGSLILHNIVKILVDFFQ